MIARLDGTIVAKDPGGLVVDCQGVGYGVQLSLTALTALGAIGTRAVLWIHTHVAEDQLRLYGFVDLAEQTAFVALLGATGVGPRLALAVLSTLSVDELAQAVACRDQTALTRIPGVGKKKAERLLLELQDRLHTAASGPTVSTTSGHAGPWQEVHSALVNLGFSPTDAERAARTVTSADPASSDGQHIPALVRRALQQLSPR